MYKKRGKVEEQATRSALLFLCSLVALPALEKHSPGPSSFTDGCPPSCSSASSSPSLARALFFRVLVDVRPALGAILPCFQAVETRSVGECWLNQRRIRLMKANKAVSEGKQSLHDSSYSREWSSCSSGVEGVL